MSELKITFCTKCGDVLIANKGASDYLCWDCVWQQAVKDTSELIAERSPIPASIDNPYFSDDDIQKLARRLADSEHVAFQHCTLNIQEIDAILGDDKPSSPWRENWKAQVKRFFTAIARWGNE